MKAMFSHPTQTQNPDGTNLSYWFYFLVDAYSDLFQ